MIGSDMRYVFDELNERSLRKLYCEYHIRDKEIGQLVGISESAVTLQRRKYSIGTLDRKLKRLDVDVSFIGDRKDRKDKLTDEMLDDLYRLGQTDEQIGKKFGMTGEGVAYRRKKLGIKTRTPDDRRKEANEKLGQKDLSELSREELVSELRANKGIKGVARKYRSTFKTVDLLMKDNKIVRDEVLHRPMDLSDIQRKLIIGSLLGDAGIHQKGKDLYVYKEYHDIVQEKYLRWKMGILKEYLNGDAKFIENKNPTGTTSYGLELETKSFVGLKEFRDVFYVQDCGKWEKDIPEQVIRDLDFFTFTVWFCDDGTLSKGTPAIVTGSPEISVFRACDLLNSKFGLECSIEERKDCRLILFNNIDAFISLVRDYLPSHFIYKIPPNHRFKIRTVKKSTLELEDTIKKYTPEEWRKLESEKEKDVWVENIVKYYKFMGFPYFKYNKREEFLGEVGRLKNTDLKLEVSDGIFYRVSSVGSALASSYFPNMWASRSVGRMSVLNRFDKTSVFRKVIHAVLTHRETISDISIRNELRLFSTIRNFKPAVAKTIYDLFCPKGGTVFDYSAGWGGRLLGAYASDNVSTYIGTDPNKQTFLNLRAFERRLHNYYPSTKAILLNSCSEDTSTYEKIKDVDVCFSSPPYFDRERYSDEPTQSWIRYPEYDKWIECFLKPTVYRCCEVLKPNGFFIINVANIDGHELQRDAFDICSSVFRYNKVYIRIIPQYRGSQKYEPIFVFRKEDKKPDDPSYDKVLSYMDTKFRSCSTDPYFDLDRKKDITRRGPLSDEEKEIAKKAICKLYDDTGKVSRSYVSLMSRKSFPYSTDRLERAFGSWNNFLRVSGVPLGYKELDPKDRVKEYRDACLKSNKALTFYEYEKIKGGSGSSLKRLFNKGKKYHHLLEELKEVVLKPSEFGQFLEKMDKVS